MYATLDDLICRFGPKEISKRADDGRGLITDFSEPDFTIPEIEDRINCALEDACFFIRNKLGCCFDLKCLKDLMEDGHTFGILKVWAVHIARYYLHEDISMKDCDHIVWINYNDVCKQIEKMCDCGCLTSDQGEDCGKKCTAKIKVACRDICIPMPCEVCCDDPCCCDHKQGNLKW